MITRKDTTEMGENHTGVDVAPDEARKTAEGARKEWTPGTDKGLAALRAEYIRESEGVGSLPQPSRKYGHLKPEHARVLLDKLGEREAFERSGVRLYDALITKVEASGERGGPPLADLRHIRDQELEHFRLVASVLDGFGGDSTSQSPCADVTAVASRGLMQVVTDPRTTVAQSLSAVLTAELTDNAGWELLLQLCDRLGLEELSGSFAEAYTQEQEHVALVRSWVADGLTARL